MLVNVSPHSPQWMPFGIKDDFIELQGFRRREEQIKILQSLGQDETLHFIELLFTYRVGERSVTRLGAAIFNKVAKHFLAHAPILRVTGVMIKIISGLNDLRTQMITSANHSHRFVLKTFRLDTVQVPPLERRSLQATRTLQITGQGE